MEKVSEFRPSGCAPLTKKQCLGGKKEIEVAVSVASLTRGMFLSMIPNFISNLRPKGSL